MTPTAGELHCMADVFISYCEQMTLELAQDIEAKGFSTFWHESAMSGEDGLYQKSHAKISESKAVVVIWTASSVTSPLIRSVAQEATRQGKLIQIRDVSLDKRQIPLPFRLGLMAIFEERAKVFEALKKRGLQTQTQSGSPVARQQKAIPETATPQEDALKVWVGMIYSAQEAWLTPGTSFADFEGAPEMVVIPAGSFTMGSKLGEGYENREYPQHTVTIPQAFAVAKYPVTFDEWHTFANDDKTYELNLNAMGYEPDDAHWGRGKRPVINVSWYDAQDYITWLNAKVPGSPYRFLSEAEWEYACLAGSATSYCFGNFDRELDDYAWSNRNARGKTYPVGQKKPNDFGLFDMHGNIWEWCEDDWHDSYETKPEILKSTGGAWVTGDQDVRVLRGGSWLNVPTRARAAYRFFVFSGNRYAIIGFRVARTLNAHN